MALSEALLRFHGLLSNKDATETDEQMNELFGLCPPSNVSGGPQGAIWPLLRIAGLHGISANLKWIELLIGLCGFVFCLTSRACGLFCSISCQLGFGLCNYLYWSSRAVAHHVQRKSVMMRRV